MRKWWPLSNRRKLRKERNTIRSSRKFMRERWSTMLHLLLTHARHGHHPNRTGCTMTQRVLPTCSLPELELSQMETTQGNHKDAISLSSHRHTQKWTILPGQKSVRHELKLMKNALRNGDLVLHIHMEDHLVLGGPQCSRVSVLLTPGISASERRKTLLCWDVNGFCNQVNVKPLIWTSVVNSFTSWI